VLGIPSDVKVAIFVGRLGKEKSIDTVLDYWSKHITADDKLHFLVVGEGPARDELEEQAKQLGINHMVTFAGRISHENIPPYYAICDFYLTASLSEMHSISMLEGMASGLPVLQRLDELNKDQINDGTDGFIYENADEMTHILRQIRDKSPDEMASLRENVLLSVQKSNGVALANSLLSVYEAAIADMKMRSFRQKIIRQKRKLGIRAKHMKRRLKRKFL
jgi:1,2-diacylglycerol 3-alpha-glucosyltransferase